MATIKYIIPAIKHSRTVLAITRSRLNICPPYTIRYPSPALLTKYSPIIVPTQVKPTLIFSTLINSHNEFGKTNLVSIWNLLAPILLSSIILFWSHPLNAFSIDNVVITTIISISIATIDFVPTPIQIINTGPKAILGRLFSTTRYGSSMR